MFETMFFECTIFNFLLKTFYVVIDKNKASTLNRVYRHGEQKKGHNCKSKTNVKSKIRLL